MLLSKIKVVVAIAMTIASIKANACTNLIVGKKASADGSVIVSYSADDLAVSVICVIIPRQAMQKEAPVLCIVGKATTILAKLKKPQKPIM